MTPGSSQRPSQPILSDSAVELFGNTSILAPETTPAVPLKLPVPSPPLPDTSLEIKSVRKRQSDHPPPQPPRFHPTANRNNTSRPASISGPRQDFQSSVCLCTTPVSKSSPSENAKATGYVRGHLAPYFVMGGDRDGDGRFAAANQNAGAAEDDHDDALTVFQANYTTNIAPQHHAAFNGSGGMWYALEDWVRRSVRTGNRELWVIAGCVFGEGTPEMVGPDEDIAVPPAFFKIVVLEQQANQPPVVLAFLFPHHRARHGDIDDGLDFTLRVTATMP